MDMTGLPIALPLDRGVNRCQGLGTMTGEHCDKRTSCAAHLSIAVDPVYVPTAYRKCSTPDMLCYLPISGFHDSEIQTVSVTQAGSGEITPAVKDDRTAVGGGVQAAPDLPSGLDPHFANQPKRNATMQQLSIPPLAEGELYVGCIGDAAGNLHHVILLPGDNDGATHETQLEWAESIGGDLPTRIEQAMLWANHRDQFKKDWYWSNEIHHAESGWAWCQSFFNGGQYGYGRKDELRARAVRRLPI